MTSCTNHCRSCGSHFTSLAAFDEHRFKGYCWSTATDIAGLRETKGNCKISTDKTLKDVTVYELESTEEYRQFRKRQNASN